MSREAIASQAAKRAPTLSKPRHFASSPVSHGRGSNASFRILGMYPAPLGGCADITGLYTARYGMPSVGE
jgi:hypothetical protein